MEEKGAKNLPFGFGGFNKIKVHVPEIDGEEIKERKYNKCRKFEGKMEMEEEREEEGN